jgi:RNA polymerase sigma-B factor
LSLPPRATGRGRCACRDGGVPAGLDPGYRRVEDRAMLADLLSTCNPRERFHDDLTQDDIARRLGVTHMYVSRVLSRSLARLQDAFGRARPGSLKA